MEAVQAVAVDQAPQVAVPQIARVGLDLHLHLGAVHLLARRAQADLIAVLVHLALHPADLLVRPDRLLAGLLERKLRKMISVVLSDSAFRLLSSSPGMLRHE